MLRSTMTPSNGARSVTLPQGFSFSSSGSTCPPLPCFSPLTQRPAGVLNQASLSALIFLASVLQGVDLFLGDVPHLEVVQRPVDGVAVSLHGPHLGEHEHLGNRALAFDAAVEDLLVQDELHQGVEQVVLLRADIDAEKDPQDVALLHPIARAQLAEAVSCRP